jgi:hypothetical protein
MKSNAAISRLLFRAFWKLIHLMWLVVRVSENSHTSTEQHPAPASIYRIQCCGSKFRESGPGSNTDLGFDD